MKNRGSDVSEEAVMRIFKNALRRAKSAAEKAQAAEDIVMNMLDDMCIDAEEVPTEAENADNLKEAVLCYLNYGEYSEAGILKEVAGAYGMGESE